jgi:IS5 family transposase
MEHQRRSHVLWGKCRETPGRKATRVRSEVISKRRIREYSKPSSVYDTHIL